MLPTFSSVADISCTCYNGAACSIYKEKVACFCQQGFTGKRCEKVIARNSYTTDEIATFASLSVAVFILFTIGIVLWCSIRKVNRMIKLGNTIKLKDNEMKDRKSSIPMLLKQSKLSVRPELDPIAEETETSTY
ncbi:hypothetical protein TrispH2_002545 [Trichoplax sp. H2]|nr:hypothetical protein TrispH2_002545 [Trichoplax sp. H2]|eukprot:RDD45229.1 hypothetical protein TrispH2_002545 [Trichoplax sp. H2]